MAIRIRVFIKLLKNRSRIGVRDDRRKNMKKINWIIVFMVFVVAVGTGAFFGNKMTLNNGGQNANHQEEIIDVSETIQGRWISLDDNKSEIEFVGDKKIDS